MSSKTTWEFIFFKTRVMYGSYLFSCRRTCFSLFVSISVAIQLIGQHIKDILTKDPVPGARQPILLHSSLSEPGNNLFATNKLGWGIRYNVISHDKRRGFNPSLNLGLAKRFNAKPDWNCDAIPGVIARYVTWTPRRENGLVLELTEARV